MVIKKYREQEFDRLMGVFNVITVILVGGTALGYLTGEGLSKYILLASIPNFDKYLFFLFAALFFALRAAGWMIKKDAKLATYGFGFEMLAWAVITKSTAKLLGITQTQDTMSAILWAIIFIIAAFWLLVRYEERGDQRQLQT